MKKLIAVMAFAGVLSVPSVIFADASWYGSLRGGVEVGGGNDASFKDGGSRWGIKGSSEISEGLSAVYRFEHKISTANASQPGGRLAYAGLSGAFGTVSLGQVWSASFNHVGAITDGSWFYGNSETSYRVGNALSYAMSAGAISMQLDAVMDGGTDTGDAVDQLEFGMTVNLGDIGKLGIAYIDTKDKMVTSDVFVKGTAPTFTKGSDPVFNAGTLPSFMEGTDPIYMLEKTGDNTFAAYELKVKTPGSFTEYELEMTSEGSFAEYEIVPTGTHSDPMYELKQTNEGEESFQDVNVDYADLKNVMPVGTQTLRIDSNGNLVSVVDGDNMPLKWMGTNGFGQSEDVSEVTNVMHKVVNTNGVLTGLESTTAEFTPTVVDVTVAADDTSLDDITRTDDGWVSTACASVDTCVTKKVFHVSYVPSNPQLDPNSETPAYQRMDAFFAAGDANVMTTAEAKSKVQFTVADGTNGVFPMYMIDKTEDGTSVTYRLNKDGDNSMVAYRLNDDGENVMVEYELVKTGENESAEYKLVQTDAGTADTFNEGTLPSYTPAGDPTFTAGTPSHYMKQTDVVKGSRATHVAAQFNLGAVTGYLGYSQNEENGSGMKDKTTHYGVSGGLGETGISFHAMARSKDNASGMDSNPWLVGLTKGLGGGATVMVEHGNADDGKSGKTRFGLKVDF